jgi:hypothetical protein
MVPAALSASGRATGGDEVPLTLAARDLLFAGGADDGTAGWPSDAGDGEPGPGSDLLPGTSSYGVEDPA